VFENLDQSLNIIDEYTLTERMPNEAPDLLRQHWETWTRYEDFQKIASAGFNVVRIPIGYWAYDNSGSPYMKGADEYLQKALEWARTTVPPLKVIIDLHGAPGSQNGYDNSGQRTKTPTWLTDGGVRAPTAHQTLCVTDTIASIYATPAYEDVVVGIELINEPQGWRLKRQDLVDFYHEGFGKIRHHSNSTVVVISDAFEWTASWNHVLTPHDHDAHNVAIGKTLNPVSRTKHLLTRGTDHHHYHVFSPAQVALSPSQQIRAVCAGRPSFSNADKWTFVGEWTGALTDCAKYLNGYGVGTRYDGSFRDPQDPSVEGVGSCDFKNNLVLWDEQMKTDTRRFIEAQLDAYESKTQGWFWWNFKTEGAHEWDAFALLDAGIFPQPLSHRVFPNACEADGDY
jgi:glucan 1,3-beta-glucosidase